MRSHCGLVVIAEFAAVLMLLSFVGAKLHVRWCRLPLAENDITPRRFRKPLTRLPESRPPRAAADRWREAIWGRGEWPSLRAAGFPGIQGLRISAANVRSGAEPATQGLEP